MVPAMASILLLLTVFRKKLDKKTASKEVL